MIKPKTMQETMKEGNCEPALSWLVGREIHFVSFISEDEKCLPYIQLELEGGHSLRIYTNPYVTLEWFVSNQERTEPITAKEITDGV